MALTINRNKEITQADFIKLSEIFKTSTKTGAIYAAVRFALENAEKQEKYKQIEKIIQTCKSL